MRLRLRYSYSPACSRWVLRARRSRISLLASWAMKVSPATRAAAAETRLAVWATRVSPETRAARSRRPVTLRAVGLPAWPPANCISVSRRL
jgi:hypothetical protein